MNGRGLAHAGLCAGTAHGRAGHAHDNRRLSDVVRSWHIWVIFHLRL